MKIRNVEDLEKISTGSILDGSHTFLFEFPNGPSIEITAGAYRFYVCGGDDSMCGMLFEKLGVRNPAMFINEHFYNIEDKDLSEEREGRKLDCFPESVRDLSNFKVSIHSMLRWMFGKLAEAYAKVPKKGTAIGSENLVSSMFPVLNVIDVPDISINI